MMQRAYRRIYKSVGTEERMVSRIQGSKIGNEKISTRTGNHKNTTCILINIAINNKKNLRIYPSKNESGFGL